jgi:hypothetical protein
MVRSWSHHLPAVLQPLFPRQTILPRLNIPDREAESRQKLFEKQAADRSQVLPDIEVRQIDTHAHRVAQGPGRSCRLFSFVHRRFRLSNTGNSPGEDRQWQDQAGADGALTGVSRLLHDRHRLFSYGAEWQERVTPGARTGERTPPFLQAVPRDLATTIGVENPQRIYRLTG